MWHADYATVATRSCNSKGNNAQRKWRNYPQTTRFTIVDNFLSLSSACVCVRVCCLNCREGRGSCCSLRCGSSASCNRANRKPSDPLPKQSCICITNTGSVCVYTHTCMCVYVCLYLHCRRGWRLWSFQDNLLRLQTGKKEAMLSWRYLYNVVEI